MPERPPGLAEWSSGPRAAVARPWLGPVMILLPLHRHRSCYAAIADILDASTERRPSAREPTDARP